jgi:hypothetical protein
MGSTLSPIVANLFMESFERSVLSSARLTPTMWRRYVDMFVLWPHNAELLVATMKVNDGWIRNKESILAHWRSHAYLCSFLALTSFKMCAFQDCK